MHYNDVHATNASITDIHAYTHTETITSSSYITTHAYGHMHTQTQGVAMLSMAVP